MRAASPGGSNWARLLSRLDGVFFAATAAFILILATALMAPWIAPYDPLAIDFGVKLLAPGSAHLFGTDELGRDVFSQVLCGARLSLLIGVCVVAFSVALGVAVGAVAGYFGGLIDNIVMRISDVFLAFPPLLLPIMFTAALGPSIQNMIVAIAISWFPWYARIVRASLIRVRSELYIAAAKAMGIGDLRILIRHGLPNSLTPVMVQGSMDFGNAILTAASLSFIGIGARPPAIEWGLLVAMSRTKFLDYWWTATFPGLAMVITVLAVNLVGDGLRDLLDPKRSAGRP